MSSEAIPLKNPDIEVCYGPQCSDVGGRALSDELDALGLDSCMGDCRSQCPNAPLVLVDNRMITNATAAKVQERVKQLQDEAL